MRGVMGDHRDNGGWREVAGATTVADMEAACKAYVTGRGHATTLAQVVAVFDRLPAPLPFTWSMDRHCVRSVPAWERLAALQHHARGPAVLACMDLGMSSA